MPESGRVIGLEITEFFEELTDLNNDAEDVVIRGVVMHAKPLHFFVVFDHWVKTFLLELLPVTTQLILVMRVEEKKEVFDVRNHALELEVVFGTEKVVSLLLQLTDRVVGGLQHSGNPLVPSH